MDDRLTPLPRGARASFLTYELPLRSPLELAGETIAMRRGLVLRVQTHRGDSGWGEAAPLPGFSRESIDDVLAAGRAWADGNAAVGPPSLAYAVDAALADAAVAEDGHDLDLLAGERRWRQVHLNALVTGGDDVDDEAQRVKHVGCGTVKMKVGRMNVDGDVARVRRLREALGRDVAIRLDANRVWDLAEAGAFLRAIEDQDVEYVEEPLRDAAQLRALADESGVPIALDETVRDIEPADLERFRHCRAIVLKPSLMGSFTRYAEFLASAERFGLEVVLSSAFDSGIGLKTLLELASRLPKQVACGFAPYLRLADDLCDPPFEFTGCAVPVDEICKPRRVRTELLTEA